MVYGTLFMTIIATLRGHPFIIDMSPGYLFSLAWLILVSSVMTFACYLSLVGRIGPGRAAYATVVFPIFALLISARYEGYEWSVAALAGLGLVIIGNLIMIGPRLIRSPVREGRRRKRPGRKRHHRAEGQHVSKPHIPAGKQSGFRGAPVDAPAQQKAGHQRQQGAVLASRKTIGGQE